MTGRPPFLADLESALDTDWHLERRQILSVAVLLAAGHRPPDVQSQLGLSATVMRSHRHRLKRAARYLEDE